MMWYSSDRRDDLLADRFRRALLQQRIEVHPRPEPRDEAVALLGVLQADRRAKAHVLVALPRGDDDHFEPPGLSRWSFALRQVAAQHDLLRAGRQVRQPLGIDAGHAQAMKLQLDVPQARLGQFAEQLQSDASAASARR